MIISGEGIYKVFLEKKELGDDLIFILGGGEKPHIGGAVLCEPGQKPYILTYDAHHDHIVLTPIAKAACKKYNKTVIAIGGIHIDNATKEEIQIIVDNCKELVKCI
jgi:metal-dependent hydrolase (beta-lactamase superfamily II)